MSRSALSARAFAVYLFLVGVVFVVAPNSLLSIVGAPRASEAWIHVAGVLAFNIGVYAWVLAEHESFLKASVYTRSLVFLAFGTFALIGVASPVLALLGVVDLLGALWTHLAMRAEASARESPRTTDDVARERIIVC